jgi:hypothetical protein
MRFPKPFRKGVEMCAMSFSGEMFTDHSPIKNQALQCDIVRARRYFRSIQGRAISSNSARCCTRVLNAREREFIIWASLDISISNYFFGC